MEAKFFPRKDYDVEVCAHRLGKSMTYTEQSDGLKDGAEAILAKAAAEGIRVGVFWGMSGSEEYRNIALPYVNSGQLRIDAYCHPTNSEVPGTIITQEVYEAERDRLLTRIDDWFGLRPLAMSYNSGNTSYADYIIPDFLAGRNSGRRGGTPYGAGYGALNNGQQNTNPYTTALFKSKESTSRWYDDAKEKVRNAWYADGKSDPVDYSHPDYQHFYTDDIYNIVASKIDDTLQNHGWYNNFQHWHGVIADNNLSVYEDYLDMLAEKNVNNDIYFAGYGEAVAYLVYRQIITKAVMYSPTGAENDKLVIRLETVNSLNIDTDLLQVPISVKFSTVGTPLAGQIIKSSHNLISLGSGQYIVEIPYAEYPGAVIEKVST